MFQSTIKRKHSQGDRRVMISGESDLVKSLETACVCVKTRVDQKREYKVARWPETTQWIDQENVQCGRPVFVHIF